MRKLDFQNIRPLERQEELDWLLTHFDSILANGSSAVLLEAPSGMGKSTLLKSLLTSVADKALICYGKFEERTAASEPFAAIMAAMDTLFEKLLSSGEGERWGRRIRDSLDVEIHLLQDSFPSFQGIVKAGRRLSESTESSDTSFYFDGFGNMTDKEWRFERLRLAMRSLFRCLSENAPVVFALDDLHWVDPDSLALIRTLIHDSKKERKFLFVGTTRPLQESPALTTVCAFPRDKVALLSLKGLSVTDTNRLVSDLLKRSSEDVISIAECLQRHTGGNPFTVIHFLRRLEDQHCFLWNDDLQYWNFDVHETVLAITVIDRPAEVVRETILSLDEQERLALLTAASFGTSYFEVTTIVHALEVLEPKRGLTEEQSLRASRQESVDPFFVQNRIRTMKECLARLADKGFVCPLERHGHYKFAHDSVRETAYSLLPEGRERRKVHLGIGRQIRLWMDAESELGTSLSHESLVLHAAKHLNAAADLIDDPWELVDLAELNYQAAELVASKSSFFPALEYLSFGLQLLGGKGWKDHYALANKLSLALTRIQYSLGLYDECLKTADTVLEHGKLVRDEIAVYHSKIFCLMQQDRFPEALDVCIKILKDLGQPFPKRFLGIHVIKDFKKAAKLLKGKTDGDLLALPRVDDEQLNNSIEFMERMAEMSLRGIDPAYFNLFSFRCVHLTMERGLFPLSTYAFMAWAWSKAVVGDHEEAVRFGNLALRVADEHQGLGRFRDTRIRIVYWNVIAHWRRPYKDGLQHLFHGVKELWEYSAVDYVHWHGANLCRLCIASGYDLRSTLAEIEKFGECLLDYKQDLHWRLLAPFHQSVLNLMGKSPEKSRLVGEIIDEESRRTEWKTDPVASAFLELNAMMIAYFFHDYERAYRAWQRQKKYNIAVLAGPDCWVTLQIFYSGLVLAAVCRNKNHRSEKRKAQSQLLQLRMWNHQGNVSCRHMCLLLEAELLNAGPCPDAEEIVSLYAKAGEAACQVSMIQHEALAYELAGRFTHSQGDRALSLMYFSRAVALYDAWGAAGKVNQIRTDFREVLLSEKEDPDGTTKLAIPT